VFDLKFHKIPGSVLILIVCAGYTQILNTFWFHDDWVFLANAAGIEPRGGGLARWISYVGYWKLFWPAFGLESVFWGVTRFLLHVLSSLLVMMIGGQVGLSRVGQLLSGFIFASGAVAFESLYWGTGAIELLGGFFSLLALWLWLTGRGFQYLALVAAMLAILSKESSLFLPVFFALHWMKSQRRDPLKILGIATVVLFAVLAITALRNDFGSSAEYALTLQAIPRNMLALGFWLVAPPPFQRGLEWTQAWPLVVGALVWVSWIFLALKEARSGRWAIPLVLLLTGISMGPAALLSTHVLPRYDYLPTAGLAFTIGWVLDRRLRWVSGRREILVAAVFAVLVGVSTYYRVHVTFTNGRPVHRLVVKEQTSRRVCQGLEKLDLYPNDRLVFFIEPSTHPEELKHLQDSVGGTLGPRLILGPNIKVTWSHEITPEDIGAWIISVDGLDLELLGKYNPRR
jgi:hypothetical protein